MKKNNIFATGVSGFIESNLAKRFLNDNKDIIVIGLDNMNDYYDAKLQHIKFRTLEIVLLKTY